MAAGKRLLYAAFLLLILITISTAGYRFLGGPTVTFLQALYMAVITVAGVGYSEIVDTSRNPMLRVFNMAIVLFGVAITVYVFSVVVAFLVEIEATNPFWRRRMQKRIAELRGHCIVCGLGDTGRCAAEELQKTQTSFVIVDVSEDNIKRVKELYPDFFREILYVVGDATEEDTLERAGIAHAKGLITALPQDKDNLVITVVARQRFPRIRIVARSADHNFSQRILKAGANTTVSPSRIGGLRMASELIRPHVVGFLDLMLKEQGQTLRVEEIEVPDSSPWASKDLTVLNLKGKYNLLVLGLKPPAALGKGGLVVNPPENSVVPGGGVILAMGEIEDLQRARQHALHGTGQI
jgi:voltage-gated potassium channel